MKRSATVISRGKGRNKTWWARLVYVDEATGKRRDRQRRAESYADAKEKAEQLAKEFDQSAGRSIDAEKKTFEELADYCEKHYYKRAEYSDERKVAGVRGLATAKGQIKVLRAHFGKKRLRRITYADIRDFRAARLQTKSGRTEQNLSIATVNRELSTLRRMLNVAQAEGWIIKNPFSAGAPLISTADERRRERILTADEEKALLLACSERQRAHLRPLVIAALDTGMRKGELLKLRWSQVDLEARVIHVRAFHTKTMTARDVPVSSRLLAELQRLWDISPKDAEGLVFGIRDNVRMAFDSARTDAKLLDVRFHDLRHTAATRLIQKGLSLAEVGRILGHSQPVTTYRYVNPDEATIRKAADALDTFHAEAEQQRRRKEEQTVTELIN
ncbi:MAG: site-specific integrase [Acidobacteriota bacterium]|nr:site-specific integrase [Acidobacteriota bacterium]MDQ5835455.1 site-specific integrase [Acidobacteriota bacterium]